MSSAADFDFLMGDWTVAHRRLKTRLAGADDWEGFQGTVTCRKILNGMGNCDDNALELPGDPYCAISLRTFDAQQKEWSIWWLDGRRPDQLDVPVKGRFDNGTGIFLAKDTFQGVPIEVRFLWRVVNNAPPRWEQAFSKDGGAHWEPNWTMDFHRRA